MSWGPGHKGEGLARTPQDSASDSQNSAGGGCDQGISRARHYPVRVAPNPLLLGSRDGSVTEDGGSGSALQAHLSQEPLAFTARVGLLGSFREG